MFDATETRQQHAEAVALRKKARSELPTACYTLFLSALLRLRLMLSARFLMWPWQDSNLQSLVPKTNALSIRPQGQLDTYERGIIIVAPYTCFVLVMRPMPRAAHSKQRSSLHELAL